VAAIVFDKRYASTEMINLILLLLPRLLSIKAKKSHQKRRFDGAVAETASPDSYFLVMVEKKIMAPMIPTGASVSTFVCPKYLKFKFQSC
jgi:hypothetical protein